MADAVGEPGKQVEDGVSVGGEDVGQVGAIQDVLEGGQDLDPDVRPDLDRDEAFGSLSARGRWPGGWQARNGMRTHRLQKK